MARSLALTNGFADAYTPPTRADRGRSLFGRLMDWLTRSHQQGVEREIESYVADHGFDHFTDSIERDIEGLFLARQPDRL